MTQLVSSKLFINSDGQLFPKYKKNEKSLLTLLKIKDKNTMTYEVGDSVPDMGQAHKCGGVKPVNGIPIHMTLSCIYK
jgi:hypothetical protein